VAQQQEIETILARQLASYLSTPVFLVGRDGTLLFYNEAAEGILGRRFSETGALGVDDWSTAWHPRDAEGNEIAPDRLPLVIAMRERHPAASDFWITGHDGVRRHIDVHAFPLMGIAGGFVGAVALFWEKR
jgi:PAS domain-containing protein